ncbi:MAG: ABC transporter substrate-binding protein [Clostridia bacterium]|nr:ABC transporter substrate-binding protein [Clostridia bacterium]
MSNRIKRLYAFVKENIVSIIVAIVAILCIVSVVLILQGKDSIVTKDKFSYENVSDQRFAISNIKTLDPIASQDKDTYYIDKLVFSSLFTYDENLCLVEDLVKDYQCNANEGTVTITLNKAKFHKGQSLDAEDVRYTFQYIMEVGKEGPYYDCAAAIEDIQTTGNNTLKVIFKDPADASLDHLTFPILNSGESFPGLKKPNGTGSYKVSMVDEMKGIVLKGENTLTFQIFPKSTVVENLLTSYEVTAMISNKTSVNNDVTMKFIPSNSFEYIGFNYKNKALANKEMRQAIAYSMDINELVSKAYGKAAMINDCVYFPNYLGVENTGNVYKRNYNKSIKLLKKLNLTDTDKDGYINDIDGNNIKITILVNKNDAHRALVADYLSNCLDELQIINEVKALPFNSYVSALKSKDFDIVIGGYSINEKDKLTFLFDDKNYINFENQEILDLVNQLNQCNSVDNNINTFTKLKEKLIDELPYYCICYKQKCLLGSPDMDFEVLPNFCNIYRGVETWQFKKKILEQ